MPRKKVEKFPNLKTRTVHWRGGASVEVICDTRESEVPLVDGMGAADSLRHHAADALTRARQLEAQAAFWIAGAEQIEEVEADIRAHGGTVAR
jgi:hypothetical protein